MYILVEYNNLLEKNLEDIKKLNYVPVILFNIRFNSKIQINNDLTKILEIKSQIIEKYKTNQLYFSILINLEKFDNNFSNIINQQKQNFNLIIGQGGLNKENKFFIENTKVDFLINPQSSKKKSKIDFIHHFNSGLNHILCRYAKEKEIDFIYTINNISNRSNLKEIGRINQNIKFNRKYKNKIYINFLIKNQNQIKTQIELNSIYSIFEISNEQKKQSFNILKEKIQKNKLKNSSKYISNGIYIEN